MLAPGRPVPFCAGERVPPLWVPSLVAGALLPLCVPSAVRRGLFSVEVGRCRGRGRGWDSGFLSVWIFTVCEAFHTVHSHRCVLSYEVTPTGRLSCRHRAQAAGSRAVILIVLFTETLKGPEQRLFPGSLTCGGW